MREKLNGNPMVSAGLVVVLLIVAFVMLTKGGGEAEPTEAPTEATVSIAGTEASGTAVGATPGEAVEGAIEGAVAAVGTEASAAAVAAQIPLPPPPAPVLDAYDAGKTVVLLVVHDGGIDDRLVAATTKRLEGFPETAIFVVPAAQIAKYRAITLGVEVEQVPALVVLRPKPLSDGAPKASVKYGFQTQQAIEQAMRDASYDGPEADYHPN